MTWNATTFARTTAPACAPSLGLISVTWCVSMGPGAGAHGGEVVALGTLAEIEANKKSLTGQYMAGRRQIEVPSDRTPPFTHWLKLVGAQGNNLKSVSLDLPIGLLTCITGVSGSGKSTLINDTLYAAVARHLYGSAAEPAPYTMRDRITAIIAILLLALLAATTYWYSQTSRLGGLANPVSREGPDVVVDGAALTQFDAEGRAISRLIGERVTHYPSDDRVEVIRPRMVSLRADQPQIDAKAEHARVEDSGARVILTGDVTLVRAPGSDGEPPMRLNTERLVALPDTEQFSTDLPVEIERGGSRINAVGMDYDNIKRTVKLRSHESSITAVACVKRTVGFSGLEQEEGI